MDLHPLLLLVVTISALWHPTSSYTNLQKNRNNLDLPQRYIKSLYLSKKDNFNPYRIIRNDIPIIYEEVPESSVLLSVDLGLRSGFAFYNSSAYLIGFKEFRFDSLPTLKESILVELNKASDIYDLTHFVLEGDTIYGGIWRTAINEYAVMKNKVVTIIDVSPLEWRKRILSEKERKSGRDAKHAAREICRQLMWRAGMDSHKHPMNTDVAEAILIGHYAAYDKLKWNERSKTSTERIEAIGGIERIEPLNDRNTDDIIDGVQATRRDSKRELFSAPLIERYSNGNVIMPQINLKTPCLE